MADPGWVSNLWKKILDLWYDYKGLSAETDRHWAALAGKEAGHAIEDKEAKGAWDKYLMARMDAIGASPEAKEIMRDRKSVV